MDWALAGTVGREERSPATISGTGPCVQSRTYWGALFYAEGCGLRQLCGYTQCLLPETNTMYGYARLVAVCTVLFTSPVESEIYAILGMS